MLDSIRLQRSAVHRLVRRHKGRNVYVFGSCARKSERADSDIDLVIDFEPGATLFGMATLQDELSNLLGRPIDIVTEKSLRQDAFGARVLSERVKV